MADFCNERNLYLAYKGGNLERDLLDSVGARYVINLEQLSVPKFDIIYANHRRYRTYVDSVLTAVADTGESVCHRHHPPCQSHRPTHCRWWKSSILQPSYTI